MIPRLQHALPTENLQQIQRDRSLLISLLPGEVFSLAMRYYEQEAEYALLTNLRDWNSDLRELPTYNITLWGSPGCGKTSLQIKCVAGRFVDAPKYCFASLVLIMLTPLSNHVPSICRLVHCFFTLREKTLRIRLKDSTASSVSFSHKLPDYYGQRVHVHILMFDITSKVI